MIRRIKASQVGPIKEADITFGDLTVFVGPQASGKSIFLQLLKLLVDKPAIHHTMSRFGLGKKANLDSFLNLYLGEGMSSVWTEGTSRLRIGRRRDPVDVAAFARASRSKKPQQQMFYIPAQRVISLRDGMTRPFNEYRVGDPFVLRDFSEKLHDLLQSDIGQDTEVFPRGRRLAADLREPLIKHIFGGFGLHTDASEHQGRLVLNRRDGQPLSYLVWSAGQREFVPLLLGLYWLLPPAATQRREHLEWVVIEEPEMGLHPNGIGAVINLVMELRLRGYRVCLSTHSPHVLDVIWALGFLQNNNGQIKDALDLLGLISTQKTRDLAKAALGSDLKTYYFARDGVVKDISTLNPGSDDSAESGWGGLTEFSDKVGDVVSVVAGRLSGESQ
ncbi:MAG: AAA family ATPase [Gammaproteobacteria bacterium]|nr:AAA family ATPase [Gammaproteobacteria bacterium]MDE0273421.1 AAA family ATPase [Gammaproteobacteria bacterium]